MSGQYVTTRTKTFSAAGALAQSRRVRLAAGVLAYAGVDDVDCIGVLESPVLGAGPASVILRNAPGTVPMFAAEDIAVGDDLFAAADGKVATTGTVCVGVALEAVSGANSIVEVLPYPGALLGDTVPRAAIVQDDLAVYNVPLSQAGVTATLALLGAAAGTPAGAFGLTPGAHGTASPIIVGEAANTNSKTDKCRLLLPLPVEYVGGETVTLRLHARITGNVELAQTLDVTCHPCDGEAGVSPDICATTVETLTAEFVDYDFTLTPTALSPGDMLDIEITGVANDTGGSAGNKVIEIGAIQLLCDVQG